MILFKPVYVPLILSGAKTVTRRCWKRQSVKENHVYTCKAGMFSKEWFAKVRVRRVWKQKLGEMTEADAAADGNCSLAEFQERWRQMYGPWDPQLETTVIEFEVVEANPYWSLNLV